MIFMKEILNNDFEKKKISRQQNKPSMQNQTGTGMHPSIIMGEQNSEL